MKTANGSNREQKPSTIRDIFAQIYDHVELFQLEFQYERAFARRRLIAAASAAFLAFFAFALLQVVFIHLLMSAGLSVGWSAFILFAVYGAAAATLVFTMARRDPRVGRPFEGSQREVKETMEWIQKILS